MIAGISAILSNWKQTLGLQDLILCYLIIFLLKGDTEKHSHLDALFIATL